MKKFLKKKIYPLLRWSEKYTKTDMVYFASGNFWMTAARFISVGSGIILTLAFANLISQETFGTYKYILAIIGTFTAFSLSGLSTAISKTVAEGNKNILPKLFWINVWWSVPASIVGIGASAYYLFHGNPTLGTGMLLIALFNPFFNGFGLYKGLLQGSGDFKGLAIYSIPRNLIPILSMLTVLLISKSIYPLLFAYFISNCIAGWIIYKMSLKKHHVEDGDLGVKETLEYSKHLSILGIVTQLASQVDSILLGYFAGPVQLALYSFAIAPVREMKNLTENFFPIIFNRYAAKNITDIKKGLPMRAKQMFIVSSLMALLYIISAPFLFKLFFPKYISSVFASQILALTLLIQPKGLIETLFLAQAEVKKRYAVIITTHTVEITFFIILIPTYGILGAVLGTLASEIASAIILFITYKKI